MTTKLDTGGLAQEPAGEPVPSVQETDFAVVDSSFPTWRVVLLLAWPVLLQQMLAISVNFSDRLLAGRFQSVDARQQVASQSALTTANYVAFFISSYTVLVCIGSTAVVARCIGARDRQTAIHATNQSLFLAATLGVIGSVVGLVSMPLLMRLVGLDGYAAEFAAAYLTPIFLFLPMQVIEMAGIACLVGAGDTKTGSWVLALVAVLNIPFSWGFFHGMGGIAAMGFPGIALGTAVSHTIGGLLVLVVLLRGRAGLAIRRDLLWPDAPLLRRILRISVPAGIDSLSVSTGHMWFLSIINSLGVVASGAHGIAIYWESLGYLSGAAFQTAAITLVGQNLGAGKPREASRSAWIALGMGTAVMSLMGLVFFVLAPTMFRLFCPDPAQAPLVEAGVPVLRLVAFAMPGLAVAIIFTGALRGAGDVRVPLLITWIGFLCIRIPLAYVLTGPDMGLGLLGAWLAMFVDIWVRGLFFLWRFSTGRWQSMHV